MFRDLYPDKKHILLDTALVSVLLIGKAHRIQFGQTPVEHFSVRDFEILEGLLGEFESIVTTPYILAEVNTHITTTGLNGRIRSREALVEFIPLLTNIYHEPQSLVLHSNFIEFGITDVSIVEAATSKTFVLSTDGRLVSLLNSKRILSWKYEDMRRVLGA